MARAETIHDQQVLDREERRKIFWRRLLFLTVGATAKIAFRRFLKRLQKRKEK